MLVVWMLTAIEPHLSLRSPLSPEGIRWLFGRYTHSLATPLLAWLVLCVMAYGTLTDSGLWWVWHRGRRRRGVRERFAWHIVVAEAALVVVISALAHRYASSHPAQCYWRPVAQQFLVQSCACGVLLADGDGGYLRSCVRQIP